MRPDHLPISGEGIESLENKKIKKNRCEKRAVYGDALSTVDARVLKGKSRMQQAPSNP